jgi:hypothetical protein
VVTVLVSRAKALYRENLHEPVSIRRITGTGPSRVDESYATVGRVFDGERRELTGGIAQQDRKAIIYAQPLFDAGLAFDVVVGDFLIDQGGLEHTVYEVKARRVDGELVAYELTVRA